MYECMMYVCHVCMYVMYVMYMNVCLYTTPLVLFFDVVYYAYNTLIFSSYYYTQEFLDTFFLLL